MTIPKHPALIARSLAACIRQFKITGPLVAASLVRFQRKCGRSGCHCQSGLGHPAYHLTYKQGRLTRSVYVPQHLLPEVQQWLQQYKRIKSLIRHISRLALAQLQTRVRTRRRRAGRS